MALPENHKYRWCPALDPMPCLRALSLSERADAALPTNLALLRSRPIRVLPARILARERVAYTPMCVAR